MANVTLNTVRLHRLGATALFHRIAEALQERARYRTVYTRTLAELQAMSDRELSDFGFHRSELPRIARDAARDR